MTQEFVDDVDLMYERRVIQVDGKDVLGYWCTLCRYVFDADARDNFVPLIYNTKGKPCQNSAEILLPWRRHLHFAKTHSGSRR
jgi:hypothetical protein